jgi:hypothetical protein
MSSNSAFSISPFTLLLFFYCLDYRAGHRAAAKFLQAVDEAKGHGDRSVWFKKIIFEINRKKHDMCRTFKEKVMLNIFRFA